MSGRKGSRDPIEESGRGTVSRVAHDWKVLLTSVDDTEFARVGSPVEVVDGSFLVEVDAAVEAASKSDEVEVGLAVVRLVGLVDISRGEEESLNVTRE
jgi:alpha-D-ribose 1-methylphosphonate 5-triphosphate diphosphatase PhnM